MAESHLDTHLIIWLYSGNIDLISPKVIELIETHELFYCSIIKLEIQYLKEIKKIKSGPDKILDALNKEIGLRENLANFSNLVNQSIKQHWTRDPFDRLIVSNAELTNSVLLTKDETILKNYKQAVW
jgi:PIN domain nuclease of toxin-antitoxin system